jgi:ABC-type cobalt transport system substrate-binding protein
MEIVLLILAVLILFYFTKSESLDGSDSNYEEVVASVIPTSIRQ